MKEFEEKRRFTRLKLECKLYFKRADFSSVHEGLCLNVSSTGILFKATQPVTLGRALEIRTLPENLIVPPLIAFIEVTRCERIDSLRQYLIVGVIKAIKSA